MTCLGGKLCMIHQVMFITDLKEGAWRRKVDCCKWVRDRDFQKYQNRNTLENLTLYDWKMNSLEKFLPSCKCSALATKSVPSSLPAVTGARNISLKDVIIFMNFPAHQISELTCERIFTGQCKSFGEVLIVWGTLFLNNINCCIVSWTGGTMPFCLMQINLKQREDGDLFVVWYCL